MQRNMIAKFASRCPRCGATIHPGDRITYDSRVKHSAKHEVCALAENPRPRLLAKLGSEWAGQPQAAEIPGNIKLGEVRPYGGRWYMVISVDGSHYLSSADGGGWTTLCQIREITEPREARQEREAQEAADRG
jgi:hypothetical protein